MKRKSLLYESKVEYGGWTVNHVLGCSHGCTYPCYAMMLARRTGRVHSYQEWCEPRVVQNALELLEAELVRLRGKVDSVHLSFTTDPFMYDPELAAPRSDVAATTMSIIETLNAHSIPVTTLTKGVYPLAVAAVGRHPSNQYGISLVSFDERFREKWEPGAAPFEQRVAALEALANEGASTWVSVEPYPTPAIAADALDIQALLDRVAFVDKVVFGRWNYNARATGLKQDADAFYEQVASDVVDWCERHHKTLHIKSGTPLSNVATRDVLRLA